MSFEKQVSHIIHFEHPSRTNFGSLNQLLSLISGFRFGPSKNLVTNGIMSILTKGPTKSEKMKDKVPYSYAAQPRSL